MDTPTHYSDVCERALEFKEKYNLSDVQTLLYNHICRGDFKLRNEDGQLFYDKDNKGFGYGGSRKWVKKQLDPLIEYGHVRFAKIRDCRDSRYTSWYFYCPEFDYDELVDAGCYVTTHKLALIKHYLKLEDGFYKRNRTYGDIEFIYSQKKGYTFKYKGEENIYAWDHNGEGIKQDLTWLRGEPTWDKPCYHPMFSELVHDIWSFLAHEGKKYRSVPEYTNQRKFKIS